MFVLVERTIRMLVIGAVLVGSVVVAGPLPETVSVNFKDADIRDVLTGLSEATGINVVADSSVQGRISLSVKAVSLDQALEAIARLGQLHYAVQDGVYLLSRNAIPKPPVIEVLDGKLTVDVPRMDIRDFLQQVSAATETPG